MTQSSTPVGTRFGRATLVAVAGDMADQLVEAIVFPANIRGVMGTRAVGLMRFAPGPAVEREVMTLAPLDLGTAVVSGPGALGDRDIRAIIHAVVQTNLGGPVRPDIARRATAAALERADFHRLRSLATPVLGHLPGTGGQSAESLTALSAMVEEIVAYLRRSSSRLERIVLVCRHDDEVGSATAVIARARLRSWVARQ